MTTLTANYGPDNGNGMCSVVSITDGTTTVAVADRYSTQIVHSDPVPAVVPVPQHIVDGDAGFAGKSITLPQNVIFSYTKQVENAQWKGWADAGLITDELLADKPVDPAVILQNAKANANTDLKDKWNASAKNGITVTIGSDSLAIPGDALTAMGLGMKLNNLMTAGDSTPFSIVLTDGSSRLVTLGGVRSVAGTYSSEYYRRDNLYATIQAAIAAATTTEEVTAALAQWS